MDRETEIDRDKERDGIYRYREIKRGRNIERRQV